MQNQTRNLSHAQTSADRELIKWNIGWGVTNACNMRCQFCYSEKARQHSGEVLPLSQLCAFIDDNAMWINTINYGTGENALCEEWFSLVQYIRETHEAVPSVVEG